MELLDNVHKFLGLEINKDNSCYINERPNSSRDTIIKSITGFQKESLPIEYLGCPLYRGRPTKDIFTNLISKIQNRVSGWMGKLLSLGGKLVLIKSVLQALPLYLIALIKPPKSIIYEINRIMSNFFWHDYDGSHKLHWVKWASLCLPTDEGGLGLRDIGDISKSYALKLWWRFREKNTLWAKFLAQKYCSKKHPVDCVTTSSSSNIWKRMLKYNDKAESHITWLVGNGNLIVNKDK